MPSHKIATVLLSLLLVTTAYAVDEVAPIDFCKDMSIIAKEIMTARQKNKPMSETLPIALDRYQDLVDRYGIELDTEVEMNEAVAELVMDAYARPSFGMKENQRHEISTFENYIFEACYKAATFDSKE